MLSSDHDQTPRQRSSIQPRRKGPPSSLRIDTPVQKPAIALVLADSALSSANSDSDYTSPLPKPAPTTTKQKSMRNTKKLSLALPAVHSNRSTNSLAVLSDGESGHTTDDSIHPASAIEPRRRTSLASIPNVSMSSRMHRKDEDDPAASPYADGPVQILPGIWLGNEDNATNWKGLADRGIRAILNVAREVISPFDSAALSRSVIAPKEAGETFYPAHGARPAMHYLKLSWSHGQPELVKDGFITAMGFIDAALERGDGVLVHCQCGVSRSATVVIALVMRAAVQPQPSTAPEVRALKSSGFSGAYDYVKQKSGCIGPNMLLIYQLQDYQQVLNGNNKSPSGSEHSSIVGDDEEEWSRRRRMLDEESPEPECDRESVEAQEAYALDRAMEERIVARKASGSSLGSSSGIGMGPAWKARYGNRKRTGSIASNFTTGSVISEDLVEEDEKEELLGVGGGFDAPSISSRSHSGETTEEEFNTSPDSKKESLVPSIQVYTPSTARPMFPQKQYSLNDLDHYRPPPSAPAGKTTFGLPARLPFRTRTKTRPPPLNFLPPVPSSPDVPAPPEVIAPALLTSLPKAEPARRRPPPLSLRLSESAISSQVVLVQEPAIRRAAPPPLPLHNRAGTSRSSSCSSRLSQLSQLSQSSAVSTPSQTLFVFPPSPTLKSHAPHMVTVTSSLNSPMPFAGAPTPRVSSFKKEGRRRSFIGLSVPPTPTTACSLVDARGWVGMGS